MTSTFRKIYIKIATVAIMVFVLSTAYTHAGNMYFESSTATSTVGDTVVVHALLDTSGTSVNAIEGLITLSGIENAVLRDISVARSDFTLWPEKPSFTVRNKSINFSGGVPRCVQGDRIALFDLVIEIQNTNTISMRGNKVTMYANDGAGTAHNVTVEGASLSSMRKVGYVPKNEWQQMVTDDTDAPTDLSAEFGRDTDAYEGKIFLSTTATDKESGIAYFEVKEGEGDFVRTGSPYILQDQSAEQKIVVRAVDRAGNTKEIVLNEMPITLVAIILIFLAFIIIAFIFVSTFKQK